MKNVASSSDVFIAKVGQGLSYLKSNESSIKSKVTKNSVVVLGFGVNDLYNIDKYIEYINSVNYGADIYVLTVNPINSHYSGSVTNSSINSFNKKLKNSAKKYKVIDTNKYLLQKYDVIELDGTNKKTGKCTSGPCDGLHYSKSVYKTIYNYVKKSIK